MFDDWFLGFLIRFEGFLFFLPLLNDGKIGLFEVILLFLWGVYVWVRKFILKYA